ncbi:LPXTG cell wall anchor domain-containing protein [Dactylosporangium sp. NPDC005555]|uniref:LPXTG cell wall anchor domain-containing protein n=1 Tax=Dactylosporangium sp. NPDC005555 TaxID=3154889 RepID=UPI0033B79A97
MGNTLFRRVATGTAAATVAVGLSTMFASPASAHASGATGSAECVSVDGTYQITWKLTNDYPKAVTLSNVKLELDEQATTVLSTTTVPTTIEATPKGTKFTEVTFTSRVSRPATKVRITYSAKWADGYPATAASGWVSLTGPCPSPSPSKSPSASPTPSPSKSVTPSSSPTPSSSTTPPTPSTSTTPSLPTTGSSTTLPMVGTGAALVVGGIALVATLRRRRRVTFTAE